MDSRIAKLGCMAAAVAFALTQMSSAQAQEAPSAAAPADGLNLERVVVTGTATGSSKMKSSISVSTIEMSAIEQGAPTSAAEVLRSVPGIRAESSGGEGNANITVRGVPISAGGSRYVQVQEDGLPVLQTGDIAFATPDSFVKIDGSLDHLEVVRGGSASTLASSAPGGIINFISKTGLEKGGSIGLTKGVNFNQNRLDFDYGSPLSDQTRFFIGGFYRDGEGIRNTSGQTLEKGGQLRANITHDFEGGFVRFSLKHLDDQAPTALTVPVLSTGQNFTTLPGIDPRTASFYSPYFATDIALDKNNKQVASNINDGLHVVSNAIGFEGALEVGGGWKLSENARITQNSGRFMGVFPSDNNSTTAGPYTFATGPSAGQAYNGRAIDAVVFNTSINDVGNTLSDTKLSKTFQLAGGSKLTTTGGLYSSLQKLDLTWNFNKYLLQATGDNAALLQTKSSTPGLLGPAFGGCCSRAYDVQYRLTSPYLNLGYEIGALNLDGGVRHDHQAASGTANQASMVGGALTYQNSTIEQVNYKVDHTSYSVGANYKVQNNIAVFARVSDGVAFNADRILLGTALDGSAPISINTVKQLEGGVKLRQGPVSTFITVFQAKTQESNYDATSQATTANNYDAKGVELESAYSAGNFHLNGGLTYTHARIVGVEPGSDVAIGNTPKRQAKVIYQIMPSYELGKVMVGASVIGTQKSFADNENTFLLPGYRIVNAFVTYHINDKTQLMLTANNLLNAIGYTEAEGSAQSARSVTGRAIKAGLKYSF